MATCTRLSDKKTGDLFTLGQTVMTPGAINALAVPADPKKRAAYAKMDDHTKRFAAGIASTQYLQRHRRGDWGDMVGAEDARANNSAVASGERILSAYSTPGGQKIWIITEWDRSYTTILLPEEY